METPMDAALREARAAARAGEVPVGAVITDPSGAVIAAAHNRTRRDADPTAHAEVLAIRAACAARGSARLPGCALHVTLEPCAMCAGAIAEARLDRVVWGADDPKSGGTVHGARVLAHAHHRPELIDGVQAEASRALLRDFFARLR
ncbi:MAG: nucleoside deaminase [Paracoccaceae bacterium]